MIEIYIYYMQTVHIIKKPSVLADKFEIETHK